MFGPTTRGGRKRRRRGEQDIGSIQRARVRVRMPVVRAMSVEGNRPRLHETHHHALAGGAVLHRLAGPVIVAIQAYGLIHARDAMSQHLTRGIACVPLVTSIGQRQPRRVVASQGKK